MLFNSYEFILVFLPLVLIGFFAIGARHPQAAALWLGLASLVFYGLWSVHYLPLLLTSVCFNYLCGTQISRLRAQSGKLAAKPVLVSGIVGNLLLLSYYKYSDFFLQSLNVVSGSSVPMLNLILPVGISFFTFTQITFLVDSYRGVVKEHGAVHYLLFVTYFPHLVAGPLLHHKPMIPQFVAPATYRVNPQNLAVGLSFFTVGLVKKLLIADSLAVHANPVFEQALRGASPMLLESWIGALAYTLQLYFDFSGYSDMAIGLSLMFNIRLPMNFDSPYKAASVIEIWQRWHMTMTRFFGDYVFKPLALRRQRLPWGHNYACLFITMVAAGLWHGASWTFVAWGALHGGLLLINHAWRKAVKKWRMPYLAGLTLTFGCVVFSLVLFRAESFSAALNLFQGLLGLHGISLPGSLRHWFDPATSIQFNGVLAITETGTGRALALIALGLAIVWGLPNLRQLTLALQPTWEDISGTPGPAPLPKGGVPAWLVWRGTPAQGWVLGFLFAIGLVSVTSASEFLYFQF